MTQLAENMENSSSEKMTNPSASDDENLRADKPKRILIVEDNFLVALDMETCLKEEGFDVIGIADSAAWAVSEAQMEKPDLILMDIRLAGDRDGVDAARDIYRLTGIRTLFSTAHFDVTTQIRADDAAPLGWLKKPFSKEGLLASVRSAVAKLDAD